MNKYLLTLPLAFSLFFSCQETPSSGGGTPDLSHPVDTSLFIAEGRVGDITTEECTLSGGTKTECYRFSVNSKPVDHEMGPWCPPTIDSDDKAGGIWPENGKMNAVDGAFIKNLATFYNDSKWQLYDPATGKVNVTDTKEACAAAARPDVDEKYQNYCVKCEPDYVEKEITLTYVIPKAPVEASTTTDARGGGMGIAFNGVIFDNPAPTAAILSAYTIAAFDDCGGHVNLNNGYHYHASTDCGKRVEQTDGHAAMIGYAMDSYPMFARENAKGEVPADLDSCSGHRDEERGYHYHVQEAGANQFLGCFKGEKGCTFEGDGAGETCDATSSTNSGPPGGGPPGGGPPGGAPPAGAPAGFTTSSNHYHSHSHPHTHN